MDLHTSGYPEEVAMALSCFHNINIHLNSFILVRVTLDTVTYWHVAQKDFVTQCEFLTQTQSCYLLQLKKSIALKVFNPFCFNILHTSKGCFGVKELSYITGGDTLYSSLTAPPSPLHPPPVPLL